MTEQFNLLMIIARFSVANKLMRSQMVFRVEGSSPVAVGKAVYQNVRYTWETLRSCCLWLTYLVHLKRASWISALFSGILKLIHPASWFFSLIFDLSGLLKIIFPKAWIFPIMRSFLIIHPIQAPKTTGWHVLPNFTPPTTPFHLNPELVTL